MNAQFSNARLTLLADDTTDMLIELLAKGTANIPKFRLMATMETDYALDCPLECIGCRTHGTGTCTANGYRVPCCNRSN